MPTQKMSGRDIRGSGVGWALLSGAGKCICGPGLMDIVPGCPYISHASRRTRRGEILTHDPKEIRGNIGSEDTQNKTIGEMWREDARRAISPSVASCRDSLLETLGVLVNAINSLDQIDHKCRFILSGGDAYVSHEVLEQERRDFAMARDTILRLFSNYTQGVE